ncbi:MAG: phosphatidylserine decarboxylase family protein [Deltaproteobacteria bacterium]|nr:phosphatidylserine decarboxylase family protein [Deltaproteobacteria bacterium]MBW2051783.1 phosphatidylserine decarboxylase family protein [Deltaproteobacteria bacterium]MBW2140629.1 phosphatidylserine decarboxylase family protein [Deltaproteobacteria bacterium]MBW2323308.1 phosphatidylserine decarboxylase family protein [Deltaproteobacteria bacterium]
MENRLPVAREGLAFILTPLLVGGGLMFAGLTWLALLSLAFGLFSTWFFRDPERTPPPDESAILSPADGTIIDISETEENQSLGTKALKISIFMSIFNVHVNRAPLSGTIEEIKYFPGKFFSANLDKASRENEHNFIVLRASGEARIAFVQIAGLVARRIACWISPDEKVVRGQRIGLIRFGSRLDVYLPLATKLKVKQKTKVQAGQSILGYLP